LQRGFQRYRITIVTLACLTILGCGYLVFGKLLAEAPLVWQVNDHWFVKGRCKEVWAITFSPDGKLMYFAGDSEDENSGGSSAEHVTIYDMEAHRIVTSFPTHKAMIKAMAVVDEGKTLITSSYDGTVEEWDAISGVRLSLQPIMQMPLLNEQGKPDRWQINAMAVSRDEKWIAVGTRDYYPIFSMIMVYNRETKTQYILPSVTFCSINSVFFPENGNNSYLLLVGNENRKILRWEFKKLEADVAWESKDDIESTAFSPDGRRLAVSKETHQINHYLWPNTQKLPECEGHSVEVRKMVFSADAQYLASVDTRGTVILWDLSQGKIRERKQYPMKRQVEGLAFCPDGKWLAVGDCNGCVELIPIPSGSRQ
jgi:WD40 repeat protein